MVAETIPAVPGGPEKIGISLRGVRKGFGSGGTRIEVLHGVDLDVRLGELMLLAGPSGCGKTTLLTLIGGLLDADAGSILLFNERIDQMNAAKKTIFRRDHIGFVFQQFNLVPTLTAAENAAVPLLIKEVNRKEAVKKAAVMLERVGLGARLNSLPNKLSGGEQQRVAIARSLIADPKLLICDEPTASLDGDTGKKVMDTLCEVALRPDRCIIVVTHDARYFSYGNRIARMLDGRITSVS